MFFDPRQSYVYVLWSWLSYQWLCIFVRSARPPENNERTSPSDVAVPSCTGDVVVSPHCARCLPPWPHDGKNHVQTEWVAEAPPPPPPLPKTVLSSRQAHILTVLWLCSFQIAAKPQASTHSSCDTDMLTAVWKTETHMALFLFQDVKST